MYDDFDTPQPPTLTADLKALLFSFEGRINPAQAIAGLFLGAALNIVAVFGSAILLDLLVAPEIGVALILPIMLAAFVVMLWNGAALMVKRLHDAGMDARLATITFVPYLNLIATLAIVFWPAEVLANEHGPPPTGLHPSHPSELATWPGEMGHLTDPTADEADDDLWL